MDLDKVLYEIHSLRNSLEVVQSNLREISEENKRLKWKQESLNHTIEVVLGIAKKHASTDANQGWIGIAHILAVALRDD